MNKHSQIVCLDIGGTTIKSALYNNGALHDKAKVPTQAISLNSILGAVDTAIKLHKNFDAIAISSAGDFDAHNGICLYATNNLPGFTGLNLKQYIIQRYGVPCHIINDAHAAMLGEAHFQNITVPAAMLTLGTGVGGAFFDGVDVVFGDDFRFGRWGHYPLVNNGLKCNCGRLGCIESYLSATALKKRCNSLELEFINPLSPVLAQFKQDLTNAIIMINNLQPFKIMIIGGGVADSSDMWLNEVSTKVGLKIVSAKLKNDAGMMGAYLWFCRQQKSMLP